jgi:hypothetical protein
MSTSLIITLTVVFVAAYMYFEIESYTLLKSDFRKVCKIYTDQGYIVSIKKYPKVYHDRFGQPYELYYWKLEKDGTAITPSLYAFSYKESMKSLISYYDESQGGKTEFEAKPIYNN